MKFLSIIFHLSTLVYISTTNRAPKAFDDFLKKALEEGKIPDDDELSISPEITFDEYLNEISSQTTPQPTSARPSSTTRSSLNSIVVQGRTRTRVSASQVENDAVEQIFSNILNRERPAESSDDSDESIFTRARRIHNSRIPQQRRRHSRRDLNIEEMERDLAGVPQEEWSCCTLGALAGDKGFLCTTSFYEARIVNRNANRVHNRRMGAFFQNQEPTNAGMSLMTKFERCVTNDPGQRFENCCNQYIQEANARHSRWRAFRHAISNS